MLESKVCQYLFHHGNISVSGVGVNQNKLKKDQVKISDLCECIEGDLLGWMAISVSLEHSRPAPVLERRRLGGGEEEEGDREHHEEEEEQSDDPRPDEFDHDAWAYQIRANTRITINSNH